MRGPTLTSLVGLSVFFFWSLYPNLSGILTFLEALELSFILKFPVPGIQYLLNELH